MKKKNVLNLIRYHYEKNDAGFREEANEIAKYFDKNGDEQLGQYIIGLLSDVNVFMPQISDSDMSFFRRESLESEPLPLPECIKNDILGIVNAIKKNKGINKFLFEGNPGTGKTESVKQIARLVDRELYTVEFDNVVDSKLGQTVKNISKIFDEINNLAQANKVIVLFDEIDSIAMDRTNTSDTREMGRATTSVLKGLDNLKSDIIIVATTNLYKHFDKALTRRFDFVVNFDRYNKKDLIDIAVILVDFYLSKYKVEGKNNRIIRKIFENTEVLPYPGDLKNIIKTCVAFSDQNTSFDYMKKLYQRFQHENPSLDMNVLQEQGFTVREIEILTGVSKSSVSRLCKGDGK